MESGLRWLSGWDFQNPNMLDIVLFVALDFFQTGSHLNQESTIYTEEEPVLDLFQSLPLKSIGLFASTAPLQVYIYIYSSVFYRKNGVESNTIL